jgi:hypothetical protein
MHADISPADREAAAVAKIPQREGDYTMVKMPRWNEDKTNGAMLGAAAAAAVLIIGGSYWPGWQFDSTAQKSLAEGQRASLVRVLAPVCAERFRMQQNITVQAAALKEVSSWKRDQYLIDNDWVIPSGVSPAVDIAVGDACADLLKDLVM